MRVTMQATERPLAVDVEGALRAVAGGEVGVEYAEQISALTLRRYVGFVENRPALTELGATYLMARDEPRGPTAVEVELVDVKARTARVIVTEWSLTTPVTLLLDQLLSATGLTAEQLPGESLDADANLFAASADDVVLTHIRLTLPPVPAGTVQDPAAAAGWPEGRVDRAPVGGEL